MKHYTITSYYEDKAKVVEEWFASDFDAGMAVIDALARMYGAMIHTPTIMPSRVTVVNDDGNIVSNMEWNFIMAQIEGGVRPSLITGMGYDG